MAYLGNNLTVQQYAPNITYFSGNGSTTAFTLPYAVVSAAQIIVSIENVIQNPSTAFSVSGTTITFTSAPPTGTNNIWVEYTSLQTNTIQPGAGTVYPSSLSVTNALYWDTSANVGIGTISPASKLHVAQDNGGIAATAGSGTAAYLRLAGNNTTLNTTSFDLLQGGSSEGYVYNRANAPLIFGANNTERMRIDSSGNVGIGTTSPTNFGSNFRLMEVKGTDYGVVQATSTSGSTTIEMMGASGIGYLSTRTNHPLVFRTNDTERARLATNGDFLVGTTSFSGTTDGAVVAPAGIGSTSNSGFNYTCYKAASATQGAYQVFFWNLGLVGYINYNGSGITYNTSSDVRLKENIVDSASGLETINKIKVREFDWKESKVHEPYGFIAQELHEIYPSAVTAQKDKEDGSMDMPWAVDYGRLTPMLVKAVQEQQAIIEDLKARIETLEAK